ncbi:hypothetical protein LTR08_008528 [Meristemomyces frigidus]|nr:hypothetical protein LTR08_008528 [Meristemomyces frigidus]
MNQPPAYTAAAPPPHLTSAPHRTIADTRALILGNASILRPRRDKNEEISLILARHRPPIPSAEETPLSQHYAFLVTRKQNSQDIEIVVKGVPRDTVEEALEWMLERTEDIVHDMLVRHGRQIDSMGCCVECNRTVKNICVGRGPGLVGGRRFEDGRIVAYDVFSSSA